MTEPEQPAAVCAATGCGHNQAPGAILCAVDIGKLGDWLAIITTQYELLSAVPTMAGREHGTIGGSTLASHRSPGITGVIAMRDPRRGTGRIAYDDADPWGLDDTASVLDTLHSWARVVREDRGFTSPDRVTVASERDTLSRSLTWIAGQEWVDECMKEVQALLGQLRATNGTSAPKPIARCHLATGDGECGGPIHQDWVNGCAYCGECRATWTGQELADLNRRIEELSRPRTEDGRVMMTVAQIVARFGGNPNSVRVKLSRAGIKGVDGYYDTGVFDTATAC